MLSVRSHHLTQPTVKALTAVCAKRRGVLESSTVENNVICRSIDSSSFLFYHFPMRLCGQLLKFNLNKCIYLFILLIIEVMFCPFYTPNIETNNLHYDPVCDASLLCCFFTKIDVVVNQVNIFFGIKYLGKIFKESMLDWARCSSSEDRGRNDLDHLRG